MPAVVQQFSADSGSLDRSYAVEISPAAHSTVSRSSTATNRRLDALHFDSLSQEDQIDYLRCRTASRRTSISSRSARGRWTRCIRCCLLQRPLKSSWKRSADAKARRGKRCRGAIRNGEANRAPRRERWIPERDEERRATAQKPKIDPVVANRAANATDALIAALHDWFEQYNGYDPDSPGGSISPIRTPTRR